MLTFAVAAAVCAGAMAQSVSGIGFGLVCGPLLVFALGARDGVRLSVVLSLVVNVAVLSWTRRDVAWSRLPVLLVTAIAATPVVAWALAGLNDPAKQALAGGSALAGAGALAAGLHWRAARGRAGAVGAGVLSAAMNVVAGIGGPAVALYAANADWPAGRSRATLQVYFLAINVVALVSLGLPSVGAAKWAAAAAGLVVGVGAGSRYARRVDDAMARRATLLLAGAGGCVVLVRAFIP